MGLFFSEAGTSTNPKVIWSKCAIKFVLQDQYANSNIIEAHTFQNRKNYEQRRTRRNTRSSLQNTETDFVIV